MQVRSYAGVWGLLSCLLIVPSLTSAENYDPSETFACADAVNVMDCIEKTKQTTPIQRPEALPLPIITQEFGFVGPFSAGVRYDTDLGWIPEISYTQIFYTSGLYFQLGYGEHEQRTNITLGHSFNPQNQIKITYEYLSQRLSFEFASGSVKEWVNQNAVGAAYRFLFPDQFLRSFEVNGYYIKANNRNLSDLTYYQNNEPYLNLRHIAGGTEETGTASISVAPFRNTLIKGGAGYSYLVYDTIYQDQRKHTTIAYNVAVEHLFTRFTKLSTNLTRSASEIDSRVRLSQIFPGKIEAAVLGEYSKGQAGQPNSQTLSLILSYPVFPYVVPSVENLQALKDWIQKPVVHANRVLAIVDEAVKKISITATNPAVQQVRTGAFIIPVNTKDIFHFDPSLYNRIDYTISAHSTDPSSSDDSDDSLDQLNIGIQSDNGSVYDSIIYSTAPMPNTAIAASSPAKYVVDITAKGYRSDLSTPIVATAQLQLIVSYDSNNEPQWDSKKIQAGLAINLDVTDTPGSINLDALIKSNPAAPSSPEFSLQDSTDPNWEIKTDKGHSYLTRKPLPGDHITFDADFIGNQEVRLSVKYKDDPDSTLPNLISLPVVVNRATDIGFQWKNDDVCKIQKMKVIEPIDTKLTQSFNWDKCVIYTRKSETINIIHDSVSFKATTNPNYKGGLVISVDRLTINPAVPFDLNKTFTLIITADSKAVGQNHSVSLDSNEPLKIEVMNQLDITGVDDSNSNGNETRITGTQEVSYAVLHIYKLDINRSYSITPSSVDISYNDPAILNPLVCQGIVNSPDPKSAGCLDYKTSNTIQPIKPDSHGDATITGNTPKLPPTRLD